MHRTRLMAAIALFTAAPVLAACGGSNSATPSASVSASASASASTSATVSPSVSPTDAPTEAFSGSPTSTGEASSGVPTGEAGGDGDVSTFCRVFTRLPKTLESTNPTNPEESAAVLRDAAQTLRASAPAEISSAVDTYAGLIDGLADAMTGAMTDPEAYSKKLQDFFGQGNSKDVVTIAMYVSKNCD